MAPINSLNIERPLSNEVYDELAPLLQRMEDQRVQIRKQISLLGQKQKEFEAITENMREGLVLLNDAGRVLSINGSACRIFGITAGEAVGCHVLAMDRSEALQDIYNQARAGRRSRRGFWQTPKRLAGAFRQVQPLRRPGRIFAVRISLRSC